MGKLLNEEISESNKPLILIATNNKILQRVFKEELGKKLSILFLSNSDPSDLDDASYHIKTSDVNLLPHLEEKLNYAIVFFEEQNDKNNTAHMLKKISADNTKSLFLFPAEKYKEYIDIALEINQESNIIPALYGNVLEDESSDSPFLKIIRMALASEKVRLNGDDLLPIFPISRNDLVHSIKQLLFSHKPHGLYYLFYKKPQTLSSAIHQLSQIEPELEFEINHDVPIEKYEDRVFMDQYLNEKLNLKIHYLDTNLKGFLHAIENLKFKKEKAYLAKPTKKRFRFNLPKTSLTSITPSVPLALFYGLMLFVLINVVFAILGIIFLRSSIHAFENSDFTSAKEKGSMAKTALSVPMPTLKVVESAISNIPILNGSYQTLHLVTSTAELATISSDLIVKLDGIKTGISKEEFEKIIIDTQYLFHAGSRTLLNHDNRAISNLLKPEVSKTISIVSVLPTLLGYDSEKEYLVLFMNNAELRPTGGFIGSVGRLIIENGKVKEFTIQDVYDLDGQLTRHIEPHYIIRRNLQPHLYLRDSNFDLDFQRSASMSAMIYNLESDNSPDGVVAVDFNIIKRILEITGPLKLPTYNIDIDSENSMDFLQQTIEDNKFEGSTQKKVILEELFTAITLELEKKPEYLVSIGLSLPELLDQKHILLAYQNEDIQSLLSALNYGGQVPLREEGEFDTIYDTVGFNEANIGVNKVNKDVSRSIFYEANLENRVSKAKISIRNESGTDDYKSYLRLITPQNSILRQIMINGEVVETIDAVTDPRIYETAGFSPDPDVLEVDRVNEYFKTVFGTVIDVEAGQIKTIEFEYTNPKLFLEDGGDSYNLYVVKQAGTSSSPISFNLNYPDAFIASGKNIDSYGGGFIKIEDNLITDLNYEITFTKE